MNISHNSLTGILILKQTSQDTFVSQRGSFVPWKILHKEKIGREPKKKKKKGFVYLPVKS